MAKKAKPTLAWAGLAEGLPPAAWVAEMRRRLVAWYRRHGRDLPWRRTRDPYAIWISETMLQQTQVATVIPYFARFLQRFPAVADLAAADEASVLRHWEGLGYYRRARQLHAAARQIASRRQGLFPSTLEEVQALPGIGRYTAGAILSFAFDQPAPIVEANTLRTYCRLLAFRDDPRSAAGQKLLWEIAEAWLPRRAPGEFNQAMMELGGTLCKIRQPDCERCPLRLLCPTRALGLTAEIPMAAKPQNFESVREGAIVVRRGDEVLLVCRGARERWAGLWDFPRYPISAATGVPLKRELEERLAATTGVMAKLRDSLATLKHGVTRFRITLECFSAEAYRAPRSSETLPHDSPHAEHRWVRVNALEEYALPVTGRKLAKLLAATPAATKKPPRTSKPASPKKRRTHSKP